MWQPIMLARVDAAARRRGALGCQAVGSVAAGSADDWSDLDVLVVVPDGRVADFWPDSSWLDVDAVIQVPAQSEDNAHIQLLLADGHKLDVLVTTESTGTERLARLADTAPVVTSTDLERLSERFVLDAATVLARSVRGERLVAVHLGLALRQYGLEAAMIRRDLAIGTCVHRAAAAYDDLVDRLPALPAGPTPADAIESVATSVALMSAALAQTPAAQRFPPPALTELIERARTAVSPAARQAGSEHG